MVQTNYAHFWKSLANRYDEGWAKGQLLGRNSQTEFNQGHTCTFAVGVRSLMLAVPFLLFQTPLGSDGVPGLGRQVGTLF